MSPFPQRLTARMLVQVVLGGVLIVLFASYILFQARYLVSGPRIHLTGEIPPIATSREITIEGSAENIADIRLNGRPILTDQRGNFREHLILENGYSIVTISAQDRYGRTVRIERPIVYLPISLYY